MATIDLIVLGIVKKEPLSAYDIQKLVEYRNISRWVKISTPSIYKKVIQLEKKGFIKSTMIKEGNMAEKAVYSLTEKGEQEFQTLMFGISTQPINIFLDFNAVMVNLDSLPPQAQKTCLENIESSIKTPNPQIPETAKAVLTQQYLLAQSIETWLTSVKTNLITD